MKIKPTKICKNKGCNKEFKIYRTTDKYCSYSCLNANKKNTLKPKQKPINQYSKKRKKESFLYTKKRRSFMELEENKYCKAGKIIFNETLLTTEVHHKAGRKGKLLNYVPFWLAVSRKAHEWIHANPEQSYELGFLIRPSTVNI